MALAGTLPGKDFGPIDVSDRPRKELVSVSRTQLAEALIAHVEPIGMRTRQYLDDPTVLDHLLKEGARRAGAIAEPIVAEAERLVGFLPR